MLFRTQSGRVAALTDQCPHRRMRLSLGEVAGERLRCRYHGWTFDRDGQGESPGTPKLHACATHYDATEQHGAVWIKSADSAAVLPEFHVEDYYPFALLHHRANAPLELVVDNFCEIEHTPTAHATFGYDLKRMHEVTVRFEATETSVRVINHGPPKPLGRLNNFLLGANDDFLFYDDWTTYFSPVYSVYEHWWAHPQTGQEGKVRWRLYIFFTPVNDHQTNVMTFAYALSRWPGPRPGGVRLFGWVLRRHLRREIELDMAILDGLANYDPGIDGMKLSRFDRVLGLNRDRINRLYRGLATPADPPRPESRDCQCTSAAEPSASLAPLS